MLEELDVVVDDVRVDEDESLDIVEVVSDVEELVGVVSVVELDDVVRVELVPVLVEEVVELCEESEDAVELVVLVDAVEVVELDVEELVIMEGTIVWVEEEVMKDEVGLDVGVKDEEVEVEAGVEVEDVVLELSFPPPEPLGLLVVALVVLPLLVADVDKLEVVECVVAVED